MATWLAIELLLGSRQSMTEKMTIRKFTEQIAARLPRFYDNLVVNSWDQTNIQYRLEESRGAFRKENVVLRVTIKNILNQEAKYHSLGCHKANWDVYNVRNITVYPALFKLTLVI